MALHFVGETLNKARSHYLAETGRIVQLMRGIYVDADDDIDAIVLRHSVRIARYLYPNAYLSAASAVLLGPTRDGRLFLSGRRKQRTRLRGLEIIQNEAPKQPSIGSAIVDDGMGEIHVSVSSIRQRYLEAFRLRSEHAASLNEEMRTTIAARLMEEYGSPEGVADALWKLARENDWFREGELAERSLRQRPTAITVKNQAVFDLVVAWHGVPIGHLNHDGFEWRWQPVDRDGPPLVRQTMPGKLPPFLVSLLPEGWLENVVKHKDERSLLRSGKRYVSNITIVERQAELSDLPQDILLTRLERFSAGGVFTGQYSGPGRSEIEASFENNLAQIYQRADTPRLSGVQIKAPMFVDSEGVLSPSIGQPFTHILKPAGTSGFEALPLVEWTAMALGRAAGFETPEVALIEMPNGMAPALLVERFDVRLGGTDTRMLALEDFCSVLDLPTDAKYQSTMERVARAVRPLSTAPNEDLQLIVKRAVFAWLIADGDMHLKNIALIKVAEPGETSFRSVRIAPLYDAVTTRVFPNLKHDRLALKVNGKDDNLRRADFHALAATAGLGVGETDLAIADLLQRIGGAVERIELPPQVTRSREAEKLIQQVLDLCRRRVEAFG